VAASKLNRAPSQRVHFDLGLLFGDRRDVCGLEIDAGQIAYSVLGRFLPLEPRLRVVNE
jgi:hypothetical protein